MTPPAKNKFLSDFAIVLLLLLAASVSRAAIDVTISNAPSKGGSFVARVWKPTLSPSRINITDLLAQLNGGDVVINTKVTGAEAGTITIADDIPLDDLTTTFPRTLTLEAQDDVLVNAAIFQSGAGGDNVQNTVDLTLNANLGSGNGDVLIGAEISTGGGVLAMQGRDFSVTEASSDVNTSGGGMSGTFVGTAAINGKSIATFGGSCIITAAGNFSVSSPVITSGGNITLRSTASEAVMTVTGLLDARLGAGAGNVDVRSDAGTLNVTLGELRSGPSGGVILRSLNAMMVAGIVVGGSLDLNALGGLSDLTIQAGSVITATGPGSFQAGNHLNVHAPISANGGLTLAADTNGGGVGDVTVPIALTAQNNSVQISGVNFSQTTGSIDTNGGDLAFNVTGSANISGTNTATDGGVFTLNSGTFSIGSPVTTSGGAFTITAVGSSTIGNDITTSGGNLSITLSGASAILTQSAGSDVNASGGAGNASLNLIATNGVVNTNASVVSGSAGVEIVAAESSTLKGTISAFGSGSVLARLTGTGALLTIEGSISANSAGSVSLRSINGGVFVKAGSSVTSGPSGSVLVEATGSADDVTYAGTITSGTGGVTLSSCDAVLVQSPLNANGNITIVADANFGGIGEAAITANITAQNRPVAISGATVSIAAAIDTNGGNLTLSAAFGSLSATGFSIATAGGIFSLNAGSFSIGSPVTTGGGSFTATASGVGTLANDVTTSGGNISVTTGSTLTVTAGSDMNATGGAGIGVVSLRSTGGILDLSGGVLGGGTTTVLAGGTGVNFNASAIVTAFSLDVDATGAGNIDIKNGSTISVTNTAAFDAANGDVVLNAGANFTSSVSNGLSMTARGANGDLSIGHPIVIDAANVSLTLHADSDVLVSSAISTAGGNVTIVADANFGGVGDAALTANITTGGGNVSITAAAAAINSPVTTGGGAFTITAAGSSSLSGDIFTSGGDITATLSGADALLTVSDDVDGGGGAGNSNVTLRSNAGPVIIAATAQLRAGPGGTLAIHGEAGVTLNGDLLGGANVDVDCFTGNIAIGATASVTNSGSFIAFDALNSIIAVAVGATITPGTNSLLHFRAANGGNKLAIPIPLSSGTGGIELFSDNDVIISAAVSTTGPITIECDGNGGGPGAVNATASIRSTGAGNVFIKGKSVTVGIVTSAGGSITIDNDGSALTLNGTVSTGGGEMLIESSSAIIFASGLNLKAGLTGTVTISSIGTSLVIPSTLNIDARGIALTADGAASDITLQRALTTGTGGFAFTATDQIILSSSLNTSGPISLRADSDKNGVGDLAINAAVTGAAQPVNLRGSGIGVNAIVDTTTGEIGLQPNAGTIATIASNLTGPVRVLSGTARFTTGTISADALAVNPGAILDFDTPARSLNPASFSPAGETRVRLGGTGAGQFNRILSTGAFTAGGVLTVMLEPGYIPSLGQSIDIFDFAGFGGALTGFNLPALPANIVWDTSQISVNGTIRTLTPIELWRQQNFNTTANSGPAADTFDTEGDGTANLLEYALGMNPNAPSVIGLPVPGRINIAGTNYLTLTFTRPLSATDISYRLQAGTSVAGFSDGSFYTIRGNIPTNAITTEVSRTSTAGFETILVRDNAAMTAAGSRFMRLKVTRP